MVSNIYVLVVYTFCVYEFSGFDQNLKVLEILENSKVGLYLSKNLHKLSIQYLNKYIQVFYHSTNSVRILFSALLFLKGNNFLLKLVMNENKAYFHNKHLVTFKNSHFLTIQVEQQLHLSSLNDFSMHLPLFK